jgi:ribulose-5-phosphate 4-epimerase/fuculose-1-phosphate aldolase
MTRSLNYFQNQIAEMEEGYIKFNCNWIEGEGSYDEIVARINPVREKLYALGLIGVLPDGIGFGNISVRIKGMEFLITGSSTGGIKQLSRNHYSRVTEYDIRKNRLTCIGPIKASSESLTHAMIYECSPETNAVIHIHSNELWNKLIHKVPTTSEDAPYGTAEIADEIRKLFDKKEVLKEKIIVMGGHSDGILAFGKDIDEAMSIILKNIVY